MSAGRLRRGAAILVVAIGLVAASRPAHAEAQVGARLDKPRVEVGEPFVVTIVATGPIGHTMDLAPTLPLGEQFDELARVEVPPRQLGAEVQEVWTVELVALEAGTLMVPALPVLVGGEDGTRTLETSPLSIEVISVIGEGPAELRPIAAPVTIWRRDLTVLWIGLGVIAGLGLIVLVVRAARRRARRVAARAVAIAAAPLPDVLALGRLRAIEADLRANGDPRPAHFQMSEVVRAYLGGRFGLDALEKTTDELAVAFARLAPAEQGPLDAVLQRELLAWLGARDLVKFARVRTETDATLAAVHEAVAFVERTRAVPAATPAASPAATGGPGGP